MSNSEVANLYKSVIEEVISDSRQDFEDSAIDEATLQDLRAIWMEKLAKTNVANFGWATEEESASNNELVNDLGAAERVVSEFSVPGAQLDLMGSSLQMDQSVSAENATDPNVGSNSDIVPKSEPSSGFVLPGSQSLNQTDGPQSFKFEIELPAGEAKKFLANLKKQKKGKQSKMSQSKQADGAGIDSDDDDDDDDANYGLDDDDNNVVNESDEINSDLDDSEDDENKSGDELDKMNDNYIFCLYDKVQRVKNKWKCSLKDGIASVNGKDYGFTKATGESDW